jgi:hypothetical protein
MFADVAGNLDGRFLVGLVIDLVKGLCLAASVALIVAGVGFLIWTWLRPPKPEQRPPAHPPLDVSNLPRYPASPST